MNVDVYYPTENMTENRDKFYYYIKAIADFLSEKEDVTKWFDVTMEGTAESTYQNTYAKLVPKASNINGLQIIIRNYSSAGVKIIMEIVSGGNSYSAIYSYETNSGALNIPIYIKEYSNGLLLSVGYIINTSYICTAEDIDGITGENKGFVFFNYSNSALWYFSNTATILNTNYSLNNAGASENYLIYPFINSGVYVPNLFYTDGGRDVIASGICKLGGKEYISLSKNFLLGI